MEIFCEDEPYLVRDGCTVIGRIRHTRVPTIYRSWKEKRLDDDMIIAVHLAIPRASERFSSSLAWTIRVAVEPTSCHRRRQLSQGVSRGQVQLLPRRLILGLCAINSAFPRLTY